MWACNPKVPGPGIKQFYESYKKKWGKECSRGIEPYVYAGLQIIEQAVEKVGDLDRSKIRDVIAKETFNTIVGPLSFADQLLRSFPGDVGQWQKGEFEVVMPKEKRTAQPVYPKPKWPIAK